MSHQTTTVGFVALKGGVPNVEADLARCLFREAHANQTNDSAAAAAAANDVALIVPLAEVVDVARACAVTRRRIAVELGFAPTAARPNGVAALARLAPNGRPYPVGAIPSQLAGSYPIRPPGTGGLSGDAPSAVVAAPVAAPGGAHGPMGATVFAIPQNPFHFGPSGVAPATDSGLSVESEGGRALVGPQQWAAAIAATQPEFALPPCDLPAVRDVTVAPMMVSGTATTIATVSGFLPTDVGADAAAADDATTKPAAAAEQPQQQRHTRHLPKRVAGSNVRNRVWFESVLAAYCKCAAPSALTAPIEAAEVATLSEPITLASDGRDPATAANPAAQKMDEELAKRVAKMRAACAISVLDHRTIAASAAASGSTPTPPPAASLSNGSVNAKKAARAAAAGAATATSAVALTSPETGAFASQLIYPLGAEWSLPPPVVAASSSASSAPAITTLQPILRHWGLWSKLTQKRVVAVTGLGAGESASQLEVYLVALRDAVIAAERAIAIEKQSTAPASSPLTVLVGPVNEVVHAQIVRRVFAAHPAIFAHVILYSTVPCDMAAQGAGFVAPTVSVPAVVMPPQVAGQRRERDADGEQNQRSTSAAAAAASALVAPAFGVCNFWDAAYAKNHALKLGMLAGEHPSNEAESAEGSRGERSGDSRLFDFCGGAGSGRQSGGYVHHLLRVHEMNGEILLTMHNWRCWARQLLALK